MDAPDNAGIAPEDFADQSCRNRLAVNLQDTPEAIKATLSRLELKMDIGLDRNGAIAEKYAAVAIPQTVIIDANGKIARLFIGGGPQYVEQLSLALEAVVKSAAEQGKSP